MQKMLVVLFTAPSHELARTIIFDLVEHGLIACGTIIPQCTSIYAWQGATHEVTEAQALLKVAERTADVVIARIHAMHPYDVPEIVVLPVQGGLPTYIEWVLAQTSSRGQQG